MKNWIVRNSYNVLVVIDQQVTSATKLPNYLGGSSSHSTIVSWSWGVGNISPLLTLPRNKRITQKVTITSSRWYDVPLGWKSGTTWVWQCDLWRNVIFKLCEALCDLQVCRDNGHDKELGGCDCWRGSTMEDKDFVRSCSVFEDDGQFATTMEED